MALVRNLAEAGRRIRVDEGRRQRLPCRNGWIIGGPELGDFHDILAEELNVENLMTEEDLDRFQRIVLEPNRKVLGAKCRSDLPAVLAKLDTAAAASSRRERRCVRRRGGAEVAFQRLAAPDEGQEAPPAPATRSRGRISRCVVLRGMGTLQPRWQTKTSVTSHWYSTCR